MVLTHKWIRIFKLKYLHDVNKLQRKEFFFKYTPKSVKLLLEISATKSNRLNTNIDTCQATIVHANALIFFCYLQNRFTSISRLETEEHVANVITKISNKSKFLPNTAKYVKLKMKLAESSWEKSNNPEFWGKPTKNIHCKYMKNYQSVVEADIQIKKVRSRGQYRHSDTHHFDRFQDY